jgi:PKD repeat protein
MVVFTATGTAVNPPSTLYSWNFGNGTAGVGQTVTAIYNNTAMYSVCLTVTDTFNTPGCTTTWCDSIYINGGSTACNASYSFNYNALLGNVAFTAATAGNVSSAVYSWYNGTTLMGTGVNYSTAISPGTYNICLLVTNAATNCVDSSCGTVIIANPNTCSANFYIYPDSLGAPSTYIGVNNSTNGASAYSWTWGDGTSSTGQFPSHTYASAGNYSICLTVGTPGTNCYDTMCIAATINKTAAMYSVNFGTPTSVSSVSKELATIYPNPTKDNFTIKGLTTAKYQVEIMNLNGSILKSIAANGNQAINISSLANNIYILKITNQDGTTQFAKLIKE